jgi:hypothetical protein
MKRIGFIYETTMETVLSYGRYSRGKRRDSRNSIVRASRFFPLTQIHDDTWLHLFFVFPENQLNPGIVGSIDIGDIIDIRGIGVIGDIGWMRPVCTRRPHLHSVIYQLHPHPHRDRRPPCTQDTLILNTCHYIAIRLKEVISTVKAAKEWDMYHANIILKRAFDKHI